VQVNPKVVGLSEATKAQAAKPKFLAASLEKKVLMAGDTIDLFVTAIQENGQLTNGAVTVGNWGKRGMVLQNAVPDDGKWNASIESFHVQIPIPEDVYPAAREIQVTVQGLGGKVSVLKIPFRVIIPNIDETLSSAIELEQVPELLAHEKVSAVIRSLPAGQEIQWVLGADTVILFNDKIIGKPENHEQAVEFLTALQGATHTVLTAIVLYNGREKKTVSRLCKTKVTFAPMTSEEIEWYVETGEWHGAAGGYRIQSLASAFISNIEGSYSGAVGLPIFELYDILKEQGYSILE
jgi:septum formation protein